VLLLVVFVAVASRTAGMLFGSTTGTEVHEPVPQSRAGAAVGAAPLVTGLVVLAVLGIVAWPLEQLLRAAAAIAGS